ncbi:MAG TPA: hypothetical protein PKC18_05615 [Lacipirellulaceae bacterium]|nr:hypothetical protein [Lacipirellulaceae bacterium]
MDEQIAKTIIAAGFLVGAFVWFIALRLYRRMAEAPQVETIEARVAGTSPGDVIRAVVEGVAPLGGMAKLTRPDQHSLHISQMGMTVRVVAQRSGSQTAVTAEVDDSTLRRRLQIPLAALVVLLMPLVIVGVPAALWYFVAPSPHSAVQWQSVQVLQIVHVLWPPFLVYFLWKKQREMTVNTIANLLVRAEMAN